MRPLISIVMLTMPSRARFRAVTIPQLLAQRGIQGHDELIELVIAFDTGDSLSLDHAAAIKSAGIKLRRVDAVWPTVTDKHNAAIDAATGEWIMLWDDDDWAADDRLVNTIWGISDADDLGHNLVGMRDILYHELVGPARLTVRFTTPAVIVDGLATFRRSLWERTPFEVKSKHGDVGDWIVRRHRENVGCTYITFGYVAMIHGTNATRAQPFRVDPVNRQVFDGPVEFAVLGGREVTAQLIGEDVLVAFEGCP